MIPVGVVIPVANLDDCGGWLSRAAHVLARPRSALWLRLCTESVTCLPAATLARLRGAA